MIGLPEEASAGNFCMDSIRRFAFFLQDHLRYSELERSRGRSEGRRYDNLSAREDSQRGDRRTDRAEPRMRQWARHWHDDARRRYCRHRFRSFVRSFVRSFRLQSSAATLYVRATVLRLLLPSLLLLLSRTPLFLFFHLRLFAPSRLFGTTISVSARPPARGSACPSQRLDWALTVPLLCCSAVPCLSLATLPDCSALPSRTSAATRETSRPAPRSPSPSPSSGPSCNCSTTPHDQQARSSGRTPLLSDRIVAANWTNSGG
jgi:hypothetical protein